MHHGVGKKINPIIWCAVGAALGWLAGGFTTLGLTVLRVEGILVGIFGAFIGGEFVASQFAEKAPVVVAVPGAPAAVVAAVPFTLLALLLAVGGAVVMLVLLRIMRSAVGPMRGSKSRSAGRD